MLEYRVTKYNPALRDATGTYTRDEWISYRDIGRSIDGTVLTRDHYHQTESTYVASALAFLHEAGSTSLTVAGLENQRGWPISITEGAVLSLEQIANVIRSVLREEFWCRLEADQAFVHLGYDYYMYVGVSAPCPDAEKFAGRSGLFVELLPSPYKERSRDLR